MVKEHAEADWAKYYALIKGVCPWSYAAFMSDRILTVEYSPVDFDTWRTIFKHTTKSFDCYVYTFDTDTTSEWLETKCDALNLEDEFSEWLWSHPEQGGDSTPVPVLIQQVAEKLENLRHKVGYYDESE